MLLLDTSYPVLLFKASRGTVHHGALGAARSLGRLGVPVYAIVEDSFTPLAASRYITKAFVWKRWPVGRDEFLDAISTIARIINRPTILIPLDDLSAVVTATNQIALSQWFIIPKCPPDASGRLANKENLYSLCSQLGIPSPRSKVVNSTDDMREFIEHTTFPVVVKAAEQWRLLIGTLNAKVIHDMDALLELYDQVDLQRSQMILQEFIPGEHWIYHGYCNFNTSLYLSFTGKKLLDYPPDGGSTALGLSFHNEPLRILSERILRAVSYSGISDMDWRLDKQDGQYKILDCNPRVGMNFRMFESDAAIDVVRAQHLDLTGHEIGNLQMIDKRLFIVESFCAMAYMRGGRFQTEAQLNRDKEFAWWSRDDVVPMLLMSVRLLSQTIQHAMAYFWNYTARLLRKRWVNYDKRHSAKSAKLPRPQSRL